MVAPRVIRPMPLHSATFSRRIASLAAALLTTLATLHAAPLPNGATIPDDTRAPNGRYGVTVPHFDPDADEKKQPKNTLVEISTGKVLAVIEAETGFDRALNHSSIVPPRWSADSSLLLWEISGKWAPHALVLFKLDQGKTSWQRDVLKLAQQAILERTRKAAPEKYAAARKDNAGNGSAYPDGFTVDVEALDPVALPLRIRAVLTSDPKGASDKPPLESSMEARIDARGNLTITGFRLGHAESRNF